MFQCKMITSFLAALLVAVSTAQADIEVTGQGSVDVPPDMATVSVGVQTEDVNVKDALAKNNVRVRGVVAALSECGVDKQCFETSQFTVQPKYVYRSGEEPRMVGYTVVNQVTVKVHELEKLGDVLTAVTDSGANRIGSIEFGVSKMADALNVARQRATADALARAKLYCESLNVNVGRVLSITESHVAQPRFARYEMMARSAVADSVPISAGGEKTISVSVSVKFEIDQGSNTSATLR